MDDSNRASCENVVNSLFELHDRMPDLMDFIDEEPAMPEITFHTPQGSQAMVVHGAPARTPEAAWGPSTQAAVTRFLTFATTTKTKLHAIMGKTQTDASKKFMTEYMGGDMQTLTNLTSKYSHLLGHHGFKDKECMTSIPEIKAAMKTDMTELCTVDAHIKTIEGMLNAQQ